MRRNYPADAAIDLRPEAHTPPYCLLLEIGMLNGWKAADLELSCFLWLSPLLRLCPTSIQRATTEAAQPVQENLGRDPPGARMLEMLTRDTRCWSSVQYYPRSSRSGWLEPSRATPHRDAK